IFLLAPLAARAAVEIPVGDPTQSIAIRAGAATHWSQGAYEVWVLRGAVQITQGKTAAKSDEAVLWINRAEAFGGQPSKVIAYLEGNVRVEFGPGSNTTGLPGVQQPRLEDRTWLGRFHTTAGIELSAPPSTEPPVRPAIFQRGATARENEGSPARDLATRPAQFTREEIAPPAATPIPQSNTTVRITGPGGRQLRNTQSFNVP